MWTDLKGWDRPGHDNEKRCALFGRKRFETEELGLDYRCFVPVAGESLPLVLFLHGADVAGMDNETQLSAHDIGTLPADAKWQQRHPCVILAPQYPRGMHWVQGVMRRWLEGLIDSTLEKDARIDPSRIYLYGYSAGAIGAMELIKYQPHYYAAAILICGSTENKKLEALEDTPLWFFHAEDDTIVRLGRSVWAQKEREYLGSRCLYECLRESSRKEVRYTEYPCGEMQGRYHLHTHCSWVPAGRDREAWEWLFAQQREA